MTGLCERLSAGKVVVGMFVRGLRPLAVRDLMEASPLDLVVIDAEHEPWSEESIATIVWPSPARETAVLVRVVESSYRDIAKPLDFGADGVIVPRVESAEQAAAIADSSRLPPAGSRGVAVRRRLEPARPGEPLAERIERVNDHTAVIVQIETREGLARIREIVRTSGINAVLVGPTDLSCSLGHPGEREHPELHQAIDAVLEACHQQGVPMGIAGSVDECRAWQARGATLLFPGNDVALLKESVTEMCQAFGADESPLRPTSAPRP
jgi:2-keto-3-deoxy-L-rhamnonate aldolase RhmA